MVPGKYPKYFIMIRSTFLEYESVPRIMSVSAAEALKNTNRPYPNDLPSEVCISGEKLILPFPCLDRPSLPKIKTESQTEE